MDLDAYLDRIAYRGPLAPDLATLTEMMRAHLFAVPYENLDVAAGVPVSRDPAAIEAKIVGRRRGGWCYEMNGMLRARLARGGPSTSRSARAACAATSRATARSATTSSSSCASTARPIWSTRASATACARPCPWPSQASCRTAWRSVSSGSTPAFGGFTTIRAARLVLRPQPRSGGRAQARRQMRRSAVRSRGQVPRERRGHPPSARRHRHAAQTARGAGSPLAAGSRERDLESAEEMAATLRSEFDLDPPAPGRLWAIADARWRDARAAGA